MPTVSAFRWVPDFARGKVRDLTVRWALEEIDRPYRTTLFDGREPRDATYRLWQPFGHVPAFEEDGLRLFESGAILLYLGEQDERLLPRDPAGRWAATSWLLAALNSVDPAVGLFNTFDVFHAGEAWSEPARQVGLERVRARLSAVADALGDREWLAGRFTVADIMMVAILRNLGQTDIIAGWPGLAAYVERGEARPAFERALAAQFGDFEAA